MSHKSPRASSNQTATAVAEVTRVSTNGAYNDAFSNSLLIAMLSFRDGDFAIRMPSNLTGVEGKIADAFNDIVKFSERRSRETVRVSKAVGKEGQHAKLMFRAEKVSGTRRFLSSYLNVPFSSRTFEI